MALSKIGWTHYTFNWAWGCEEISPACDNCYAHSLSKRAGYDVWGTNAGRRFFGEKHWAEPLKWDAKAAAGSPLKLVFCGSMMDWAESRPDYLEPRERMFRLIKATPHLTWLLLTKRIGNVRRILPADWGTGYPNVMILATMANQPEVQRDMTKLLRTPAAMRGVSIEPILGSIYLRDIEIEKLGDEEVRVSLDALTGTHRAELRFADSWDGLDSALQRLPTLPPRTPGLDWVIAGGETGFAKNVRAPETRWFRDLRTQCASTFTPYFFKQWGLFAPVSLGDLPLRKTDILNGAQESMRPCHPGQPHPALLDGREHFEFPAAFKMVA